MINFDEFAELERRGWADPAVAASYADQFALASEQVAPVLARAVAAARGCKALDLCSGHGIVARALRRVGAVVTGLDFSAAMNDLARRLVPDAEFVEGDATDLPFGDDSFDAVTIGFGVPHVPDPHRMLCEAARVLKPGGRISLSAWKGDGADSAFAWLTAAVARHGAGDIALPPGPDAHAFADGCLAAEALTRAGFVDIARQEVGSHWVLDSPETVFDIFDRGTVRVAALLGSQSKRQREAIRAEIANRVRDHNGDAGGPWRVPIPAVVTSARLS